jgi:hypothetical protein
MRDNEVIVFKGHDSAFPGSANVLHPALDNRVTSPDTVVRESIKGCYFALRD